MIRTINVCIITCCWSKCFLVGDGVTRFVILWAHSNTGQHHFSWVEVRLLRNADVGRKALTKLVGNSIQCLTWMGWNRFRGKRRLNPPKMKYFPISVNLPGTYSKLIVQSLKCYVEPLVNNFSSDLFLLQMRKCLSFLDNSSHPPSPLLSFLIHG